MLTTPFQVLRCTHLSWHPLVLLRDWRKSVSTMSSWTQRAVASTQRIVVALVVSALARTCTHKHTRTCTHARSHADTQTIDQPSNQPTNPYTRYPATLYVRVDPYKMELPQSPDAADDSRSDADDRASERGDRRDSDAPRGDSRVVVSPSYCLRARVHTVYARYICTRVGVSSMCAWVLLMCKHG